MALFGLFGGAVLALWLLVRPPSVPGEAEVIRNTTATPALTPAGAGNGATPTPAPSGATDTTPTPAASVTPVPTPTAAPTPVPTAAPLEYIVQDNDTWYGISGQFGVDADVIAEANGRTLTDFLHPGETLIIPQ